MSSSEIPVSAAASPFTTETTPNIERANRLISLRSNPGFRDLIRLSLEIVQSAADICADYPGWDAQQITVLKVRMQCAKEHHALLLNKVQEAIETGKQEAIAQAPTLPAKTASDMVDQGDYVRQQVLQQFDEMESRPAGSY